MRQRIGGGNVYYVFNKTCIGYSHKKEKKKCQDFSAAYQDNERIIITCCDGHGGAQYIRSHFGSKAASDAVINVFKKINKSFTFAKSKKEIEEKIKLLVLCEYNKLIEQEFTKHRIKKSECVALKEEEIDAIKINPAKAYGTTLTGAMIYNNQIYLIGIGDTEVLTFSKGNIKPAFDNSNDPVGNVTYSMCQEDAFRHLKVSILSLNNIDGILLCTDGLSSPFQTYDNFYNSFVRPTIRRTLISHSSLGLNKQIMQIADQLGTGDDVSISLVMKENIKLKNYKDILCRSQKV